MLASTAPVPQNALPSVMRSASTNVRTIEKGTFLRGAATTAELPAAARLTLDALEAAAVATLALGRSLSVSEGMVIASAPRRFTRVPDCTSGTNPRVHPSAACEKDGSERRK